MNIKAQITVTQWEDDTFSVDYIGIVSRMDVRLMTNAIEKDARKRKSRSISFSEKFPLALASADQGSPA
jgi:hypothetical protein